MEKTEKVRHTISLDREVLQMGQEHAAERDQTFSGYIASLIKQAVKNASIGSGEG